MSPSAAATGWLRGWHLGQASAARRPLVLEFGAPISGAWQVKLALVPREPLVAAFTLPFPAAAGQQSAPPAFACADKSAD